MNLLLRLLERRVVIGIALMLAAAWAGERWSAYARGRIDLMRHPPAETTSPLSADIVRSSEVRESARLRGLHRAVSAEISAAEAHGHNVDKYRRLADSALDLDTPAYRYAAVERLNKLRLALPQKKESFRPASPEDLNPDLIGRTSPKSKAARR